MADQLSTTLGIPDARGLSELAALDAIAAAHLDGGSMDCGSGLLLLLTRRMRDIGPGDGLLVRTEDASVPPDLVDWSRLAGHEIAGQTEQDESGAWHVLVRRGIPAPAQTPADPSPGAEQQDQPAAEFSTGEATPVGERIWLYSNFHCNLACTYCCAESSPAVDPQLLPLPLAREVLEEFARLGGREVYITGGEPFLHPHIGELVAAAAAVAPTTILTNAMVVQRGARRAALEGMDRERVRLQISLDSAEPARHEGLRGKGSHGKAVEGIRTALDLGFAVRIAATWYADEPAEGAAWTRLLDDWGIPEHDRLVRPVARQGVATGGEEVTVDTLAPEPTVTASGIWWHPVAVTDPAMQVADRPAPLKPAFDTIRDTVAVQDAARKEGRRHVFRCA